MAMEWNQAVTLALASQQCAYCHGLGLRAPKRDKPCDCVFRSIFRICYKRFIEYSGSARWMSQSNTLAHSGPSRCGTWSRKEEEYLADFLLTAQRELDEEEYRTFRYRFLLGADYRLFERKFGIDRGTHFNMVYRIMKKLGRAFAEMEPYPLYPLSDYFNMTHRAEALKPREVTVPRVQPIRPHIPGATDSPPDETSDAEDDLENPFTRKCA